jgi:diketogulonate reductase-like aldo/keto reductase
MHTVTLPNGKAVPALGLGTWHTGESASQQKAEIAALRLALNLGYRLIDTAEMYGEGGAETIIGQAVSEALRAGDVKRDELFIVSKVYPHNASRTGTVSACQRSLKRLQLDHIDLYLLHWPGQHALHDTVAGFEKLQAEGRIGLWGVSNFDTDDMAALWSVPGGDACATNQVYYALSQRGVEYELLPWQREQRMPAMAYSPLDQGRLAKHPSLQTIGARHGATATQVALAWMLKQPGVIAIPKAVQEVHLRANLAAADLVLTAQDLAQLDKQFPPPSRKTSLAMI